MAADVDICNQALSHLGVSVEIQNLETEKSNEARACRRFYADARGQALRDFPWPFATVSGALALVEDDPTTEWAHAYRVPSGAMAVRRLIPVGDRGCNAGVRIPYRIARDDEGQLIYTDQDDAVAEWTTLVDDPQQYPPDFRLALSLLLATMIAPRVTGGDQFKLGARAYQLYQLEVNNARANAANEEQPDPAADSEFIRARD